MLGRWADRNAVPYKDVSHGTIGISWTVFPIPTLTYYYLLLQVLLWTLSCSEDHLRWAAGGLRASGPARTRAAHVLRAAEQQFIMQEIMNLLQIINNIRQQRFSQPGRLEWLPPA